VGEKVAVLGRSTIVYAVAGCIVSSACRRDTVGVDNLYICAACFFQ